MLNLTLKTAKHSQHIPFSAYYLNPDTNYSRWLCLKKIRNYEQTFYVITKNNGKKRKQRQY